MERRPRLSPGDLVVPRERGLGAVWWLYGVDSDVREGMITHTPHSWTGPLTALVLEVAQETRSGIIYALVQTSDGVLGWIMDTWAEPIS
jgi:hypothetical protein